MQNFNIKYKIRMKINILFWPFGSPISDRSWPVGIIRDRHDRSWEFVSVHERSWAFVSVRKSPKCIRKAFKRIRKHSWTFENDRVHSESIWKHLQDFKLVHYNFVLLNLFDLFTLIRFFFRYCKEHGKV